MTAAAFCVLDNLWISVGIMVFLICAGAGLYRRLSR